MPKPRWKFSFVSRSSSSPPPPPASFICPVSSSLMFDPVILPTGHTFERACVEACVQLNFDPSPVLSSPINFSSPSSSSPFLLIPNAALKSAIIDWCDRFGLPHPSPLSQESALSLVQRLMAASNSPIPSKSQQQQQPQAAERYPNTDNQKHSPPSSSTSTCSYPSSSSSISSFSSSSAEIINIPPSSSLEDENDDVCKPPKSAAAASSNDALEEEIFSKLKNPQISVKESGLVALRHSARDSAGLRLSLCTPRILAAVVPLIALSRHASIQVNATASVVNLSLEPGNKVKIVRAGAVPPLVDALRSPHCPEEARGNAAGALFGLALEDENKLPIGVLGAIPPLLDLFCGWQYEGRAARVEAGMALYHLSLVPSNLSKIAKTPGAAKALLDVAIGGAAGAEGEHEGATKLRRVAMMVLANLARRDEGRVALMDAGAVKAMVEGLTVQEAEGEGYCLAVLYEMSKGTGSMMRFRALARAAGAERALLADKGSGEVGKEMATRMLSFIRGECEERGAAVMLALGDEAEGGEIGSAGFEGMVPRPASG